MLVGGKYKFVSKKGEGTFSEVIKAQTTNNKFVAIKRMKNHFDSIEQVNNLREVQALKKLSPHPGIIKLLEVVFERSTGRLSLVFELMEMNIYELIRGRRHYLAEKKVKLYMYQLLKAIDHMHRNGIFHRDIKPENILLQEDKLKIADFGSCRGVKSKQPFTEYISTRWYRAPECLLTDGYYNYKMDMWGIGCVFFEVLSLFPLFPGTNELDQIQKIHNIVGTPPPELLAKIKKSVHMNFNFPEKEGTGIDRLIPNAPAECIDIIKKLLAYNPDDRMSARQALRHSYFRELREGEKRLKHGSPMYNNIKPPTNNNNASDHPDEAAKKQSDPTDIKKSQLPQIKQHQHANSITNITNITNISTNITTNNIIVHPLPPTHTHSTNAHSTNAHPTNASSTTVAPSAVVVSNYGNTNTSSISHFGHSTSTLHGNLPHPVRATTLTSLTVSDPPSKLGAIISTNIPTHSKLSNSLNSNHSKPIPSLTSSTHESSLGNSSLTVPKKENSTGSLVAATNKSMKNLTITANKSTKSIIGKTSNTSNTNSGSISHHSHGDLPPPVAKKDLKSLSVLRPKPQDIEFILDKQKESAHVVPPHHASLQATHNNTGNNNSNNNILNPLPSIRGTGWKK